MNKLPEEVLEGLIRDIHQDYPPPSSNELLLSLARVSKKFNRCTTPTLYSWYFNTAAGTNSKSFWPFIRTLLARKDLRKYVRQLDIRNAYPHGEAHVMIAPKERTPYANALFKFARSNFRLDAEGMTEPDIRDQIEWGGVAWECCELALLLSLTPRVQRLGFKGDEHRVLELPPGHLWGKIWQPLMVAASHGFRELTSITDMEIIVLGDPESVERLQYLGQLPKLEEFSAISARDDTPMPIVNWEVPPRSSRIHAHVGFLTDLSWNFMAPIIRSWLSFGHLTINLPSDSLEHLPVQSIDEVLQAAGMISLCIRGTTTWSYLYDGHLQKLHSVNFMLLKCDLLIPDTEEEFLDQPPPHFDTVLPLGIRELELVTRFCYDACMEHFAALGASIARGRFPQLRRLSLKWERLEEEEGPQTGSVVDIQFWTPFRTLEAKFTQLGLGPVWIFTFRDSMIELEWPDPSLPH